MATVRYASVGAVTYGRPPRRPNHLLIEISKAMEGGAPEGVVFAPA